MLQILYPLGFIVCISGLILWFYNQENPNRSRLMSQTFLGGFFVYLFSLAFSEGELSLKLWALFRDLMVIGIVSQGFNFLKGNKSLFFGGLALFYTVFYLFGLQKMNQTFSQMVSSPNTSINAEGAAASSDNGYFGELLVDLADEQQVEDFQQITNTYDLKWERAFYPEKAHQTNLDDYFLVDVQAKHLSQLEEIQEALRNSGLIDWVEENEQVQLKLPEQDHSLRKGKAFGLNDPSVNQLWGFEAMNIDMLYTHLNKNKIKPKRKALIAILDTGVDAKHEDLKDNFKSIRSKYDVDKAGHGTHCAGIAGAVSNNNKGVASFSQNNDFVNITSVKVLSDFGGGTQQGIIKGMIEATDKGADVLSLSLGGPSNRRRQKVYEDAVKYANAAGAIVVVAAGNSNSNSIDYAPANTPGVITVSAVDTMNNRASFSNYVSDLKMGIAAPGVKIYSTIPGDKYTNFNGTSMATPYVAGLLGLLKSIQPELTTKEAYQILNSTGANTGNTKMTGRLIQPAKAVMALD